MEQPASVCSHPAEWPMNIGKYLSKPFTDPSGFLSLMSKMKNLSSTYGQTVHNSDSITSVSIYESCMVSLGIFTQGCNSDFDDEIGIENLDIPEEYNEVKVLHNEGLEYIFEEIKAFFDNHTY